MSFGQRLPDKRLPSLNVPYDLVTPSRDLKKIIDTPNDFNTKLLAAVKRQSNFLSAPFIADLIGTRLRQYEDRTYFLIQNTSAVGIIYLGFGTQPTPLNSLALPPGAVYEPFEVPDNEIYILGSQNGVTGLIIYSIGNN